MPVRAEQRYEVWVDLQARLCSNATQRVACPRTAAAATLPPAQTRR